MWGSERAVAVDMSWHTMSANTATVDLPMMLMLAVCSEGGWKGRASGGREYSYASRDKGHLWSLVLSSLLLMLCWWKERGWALPDAVKLGV